MSVLKSVKLCSPSPNTSASVDATAPSSTACRGESDVSSAALTADTANIIAKHSNNINIFDFFIVQPH